MSARSVSPHDGVYILARRTTRTEDQMTAQQTVAVYYDAWQNKQGDRRGVPLA